MLRRDTKPGVIGSRGGPKPGFFGSQRRDHVRQDIPTSTASAAHPRAMITAAHPRSKFIAGDYRHSPQERQAYRLVIHRNLTLPLRTSGLTVSDTLLHPSYFPLQSHRRKAIRAASVVSDAS